MKFISKNKKILSIILIIIIFSGFYSPLLKNINLVIDNSDYFRTYYRLGLLRKICLEYKQFPLRNPFLSGGYPIWGDTCVFVLNPLYVFIILFGEVAGLRLVIFFLFLFCVFGMFYLTRYVMKYDYSGAVFSSFMFILCSWGVFQISDGNYQQLYYYLLPWVLALFIKAASKKKFIVVASIILSLILLEAVLVVIPIILFLFIYACLRLKVSFTKDGRLAIDASFIKSLILIFLFAFLLSAVKIIPLFETLRMMPAGGYIHFEGEHSYAFSSYVTRYNEDAFNLTSLIRAMLSSYNEDGSHMFLGIVPLIFFLLSSIVFFRENWRWLILLGIFVILSFGSNSPIDFFKLIWGLHPFMHSVYKLEKYFGFFIFFIISLIAGRLFLFNMGRGKFKSCVKIILCVCAALGIIIMCNNNSNVFEFSYLDTRVQKNENVSSFFQIELNDYKITAPFHKEKILHEEVALFYWLSMLQGVGVTNNILRANSLSIEENLIPKYFIDNKFYDEVAQAYSSEPVKGQKINPLYKGEVFFFKINNYATVDYFSPNRLFILAHITDGPDTLVVNQRYDIGWSCNIGKLRNWNGLIAVELNKPGDYLIRLDYRPATFFFAATISILTVFYMCYYWRKCGK